MSGCEGCIVSAKGQSMQLDQVKQEAKQYATENNKTMAIYKEGNDYCYIEAGEAVRNGLPVMEFISQHNGTAA